MAWFLLALTILFEVIGTISIKLSAGFTKLIPSIMIFVSYITCFSIFPFVVKKLDLSLSYAIWSGAGTLLVTLIGVWYFQEAISIVKLVSISLIIVGVVGLKLA